MDSLQPFWLQAILVALVLFCNGYNRINGCFWCSCCSLVMGTYDSLKFYSNLTTMCVPNPNNFLCSYSSHHGAYFENDEPLFEVDKTMEDPLATFTATV